MSNKLNATTSRFKRQFRRECYKLLIEIRKNERQEPKAIVEQLIKNTLRQRSGHYMKKSIRQCYSQIPNELRQS